jgi:hypothetical protein
MRFVFGAMTEQLDKAMVEEYVGTFLTQHTRPLDWTARKNLIRTLIRRIPPPMGASSV